MGPRRLCKVDSKSGFFPNVFFKLVHNTAISPYNTNKITSKEKSAVKFLFRSLNYSTSWKLQNPK